MKKSFDGSTPVKLVLRDSDKILIGVVIGGSRFKGSTNVNYITGDGFYSYNVRLMQLATDDLAQQEKTIALEASMIKSAELL